MTAAGGQEARTFRTSAERCLARAWVPMPLCWPNPDGSCACGKGHTGHDVGKAPLIKWAGLTLEDAQRQYMTWAKRWPWANCGILLEESDVVLIGPDSDQALTDWLARGLPATAFRYSRNTAYLYKRPEGCPPARIARPEYGDILSAGNAVVEGTHQTGVEIYTTDDELVDAPAWAVEMLQEHEARTPAPRPKVIGADAEPPVRIRNEQGRGLWVGALVVDRDEHIVTADGANVDRSNTLFRIGAVLADGGASRSTIETALAERDETLGYRKFSDRRDGGESQYAAIADKVVAPRELVYSSSADKAPLLEPPTQSDDTETDAAPWPDPLDAAAYYGLAGDFVSLVEPHSEADPAALLAQFLVLFGNVIGRAPFYQVEADEHHTNENVLIAGPTAVGRKGTSLGPAKMVHEAVDPLWARDRILGGLSSGEGLIWHVRDATTAQEPIKERGKLIGYQTVESDAGATDKRLLVIESEFAGTLKVAGREGNTLSPIMRQGWDSGTLRTLTKNNSATATGAHISIIGHVTREELLRQMAENDLANGFANRFLFVAARRSKCLPEGGLLASVDFGEFEQRLAEAVAYARATGQMARDELARGMWAHVYPELSEGTTGLLGKVTARGAAHVLRLSMIYALLDQSEIIRVEHLLAALGVWEYCNATARWLFGDRAGDSTVDKLTGALRAAPDGLTREAINALFGRNKPVAEIERGLAALLRTGAATKTKVPGERGRPAEVWRISSFTSFTSSSVSFCAKARAWLEEHNGLTSSFVNTENYKQTSNQRPSEPERYSLGGEVPQVGREHERNERTKEVPDPSRLARVAALLAWGKRHNWPALAVATSVRLGKSAESWQTFVDSADAALFVKAEKAANLQGDFPRVEPHYSHKSDTVPEMSDGDAVNAEYAVNTPPALSAPTAPADIPSGTYVTLADGSGGLVAETKVASDGQSWVHLADGRTVPASDVVNQVLPPEPADAPIDSRDLAVAWGNQQADPGAAESDWIDAE